MLRRAARFSVLVRLLFALSLIGQTLVGPTTPVRAQVAAGPSVTFTPNAVNAGGTITVSAARFDVNCETQATLDLVPTFEGGSVVSLTPGIASFLCDGSFKRDQTLPITATSGQYRVRLTVGTFDPVFSVGILTVTASATNVLSGTAACSPPANQVLRFATVTIFSGAAQVFTTQADGNGNWSVPGSAANSTYVVRYQAAEGGTTCGVTVTTDEGGSGVAAPASACPSPDLGNRTWLTPFVVPTSAVGAEVADTICKPGQSRWFRVEILPGQQVTAEVVDPTFDVTLAMFRDIRQTADEMAAAQPTLSLEDVRRFTASIPHDVAAPDISAPDISAPDISAPDISAPDISAPDISAPDISAPDISAPDISAPEVYSSAQLQSILAYSDKPGPSSEFVRRHTWDNTGSFYIRVRGHNDAFDDTHPFTLRITVANRDCTGDGRFNITTTPASLTGLPTVTPRTLLLTNSARFGAGANTAQLLVALRLFAARPDVRGAVVDLANDGGLAADYKQWDSIPDCVPAANIVGNQIHRIEEAVRSHQPANLQYVVLVGGDHVLPFARIPDEAGLSNEHDFFPAVLDASASQASLRTGYFLSQDPYGSFTRMTDRDHVTPSFDVPVGRLVESVSDIVTMLTAYELTNGVIQPGAALVTGYDFLADSSAVEADDLTASGLAVQRLIQPEGDGPLNPSAWHADDLRTKLFGPTRFGIIDLNSHFSGNTLLASDMSSRIRSREVAAVTDRRYFNSLVMSMGCHSGYNIVDPDATPGTQPVDWAQAFAQQGATVIGGAGYQYGNSPLIKYSEVLMTGITHQLRLFDAGTAPGAVSLGRAIVEAKRAYVHGGMNGIDEKSLAELTLYGLPMLGVNLPTGRLPRPTPAAPITPQPGASSGLSFADVAPGYQLTGHDRALQVPRGTTTATYFDATYPGATADTFAAPGQPILPQVTTNVAANGTLARGAVMLSATYTDLFSSLSGANPFRPLVDNAPSEVRGIRPAYASSIFAPTQLVQLNDLQGQFLLERPFQFRSNDSSVFGIGRRYDTLTSRVFYSSRTDASALSGPPVIYSTVLKQDGSRLLVDVTAGNSRGADIETVLATYTSEPTEGFNALYGRWNSVALTAGPSTFNTVGFVRHYTGVIDTVETGATPATVQLFIQAVGGNALVSQATNNGSFFRLVTETATLGSPKVSTVVALQQPLGESYSANYRSTLHVSARLASQFGNSPLAGKTLTFSLGRTSIRAVTAADGTASVDIPVLVIPDSPPPRVVVDFAEDPGFLGSSDHRDVSVSPSPTAFVLSSAPIAYGGAANVALLVAQTNTGDKPLAEVGVHLGLPDGRQLDALTDGFGRVLFDTLDFEGVQPGTYSVTLDFAGSERYQPATATLSQTVAAEHDHSLSLNGKGFAEVPDSPELNLTRDWTIEMWFRNDNRERDPEWYADALEHGYHGILDKGDGNAPEAPYFVRLGHHDLVVGLRSAGKNYTLRYRLLHDDDDAPAVWQHMAATFNATTGELTLFINGQHVAQTVIKARSTGNDLPLEIGRLGPRKMRGFVGKLDDIRLWNVVRSADDIQSNFRGELTSAPPGLVANWKFDERLGTFFAYSSVGTHTATLSTSGAALSTDVHP